ncbi:sNF2 family N-terminal domain [Clostridium sp. CAG:413]|nr:sNF2 family N-terminal domain [Clostridium sp. CAG:413]
MGNPPATEICLKKEEAENRKNLREYITSAVRGYALETREKTLMNYRGFDIVLPANMAREKPYICLSRQGKYYVELGDTEIGNLLRIDNYLDTLDKHLEKLKVGLSNLIEKEIELKAELAKNENYSEQIEKYSAEVEKLDKKLGVNKK